MTDLAATMFCRYCAAQMRPGDQACWLCKTPLEEPPQPTGEPARPAAQLRAPSPDAAPAGSMRERASARLAQSRRLLYLVLAVVFVGVLLVEPGAAFTVALMAAPAILALEVARRKALKSGQVRARPRVFLSFILSGILANVLLAAAAFIGLAMACLAGSPGRSDVGLPLFSSEGAAMFGLGLCTLGAVVVIVYTAIKISTRLLTERPRRAAKQGSGPAGIGIATLILVIAEFTVAIGVGRAAPGFGIILGAILIPGTLLMTRRSQVDTGALGRRRWQVLDFVLGSALGLGFLVVASGIYLLFICTRM